MIPCKDCLVLAACKNKEKIYCSLLVNWSAKYNFGGEDCWKAIHSYLSKVVEIHLTPISTFDIN